MPAGVQHHLPRGPASPQLLKYATGALVNLVAAAPHLIELIICRWRMPVGLHSKLLRLTHTWSPVTDVRIEIEAVLNGWLRMPVELHGVSRSQVQILPVWCARLWLSGRARVKRFTNPCRSKAFITMF